MVAKKLSQVLAVEKTVKAKREDQFTQIYRNVEKPELTSGFTRSYQPKADDGEKLPTETKKVQLDVETGLKQIVESMREVFNITALKDATNCVAKADIVVDGETLVKNVPASHLLWLEKKLGSFQDLINKLPTLSADTDWRKDEGTSLFKSDTIEKLRSQKIERWETIVPPTKEHPARVEKVIDNVTVGTWKETILSGAIPVSRKQELLNRVEKFMRAVKEARETANQAEVVELSTGLIVERIFAP